MAEELQGYKYKGEDILFLVELDEVGLIRPFDQTGGSHTISADELDVSTKDRTGADYGEVTEEISLEGELVYDDPFIPAIKKAIRGKKHVKIYKVDTVTKQAEYGMYMISSFDQDFAHDDYATYTLDASLFGSVCETSLTEIPEGAPELAGMSCDEGGNTDG